MGEFRTIVADPPWRYLQAFPFGGRGELKYERGAEFHYPTMSNEEIAAIPVADMAADSAHLYLWVTTPRLYGERKRGEIDPFEIARRWGFEYRTLLTWHKLGSPGMGSYFRIDTEHVLFCVRGTAPIAPALRVSSHFAAPRTRHSAKPDRFYEIVERVSPEPRLELFARRRRVGWDVWGDEAPPESEARTQLHAGLG